MGKRVTSHKCRQNIPDVSQGLFETLCLKNGIFRNESYHAQRFARSVIFLLTRYWQSGDALAECMQDFALYRAIFCQMAQTQSALQAQFVQILADWRGQNAAIVAHSWVQNYRVRVDYRLAGDWVIWDGWQNLLNVARMVDFDICAAPHTPRAIRRFRLVADDSIDYGYKFADRCALERLDKMQAADEAIIILKNQCVTDTLIGNLLFLPRGAALDSNSSDWLTPDTPLLVGTQRQYLLNAGRIKSARILLADLPKFSHAMLINALNEFDLARAVAL